MNIETYKLTDSTLDWAVAKCEGNWILDVTSFVPNHELGRMCFSTDWSQGGPIIEREMLAPEPMLDTNCKLIKWCCRNWKGDGSDFYGPTPLIAAMRCFVASEMGDEVVVPDELCK